MFPAPPSDSAGNTRPSLRSGGLIPAWRHNPVIKAFCERLKAHGKSGKAVACAAMRKLLHIAFGVLKSGRAFDPKLALAK